jgi:hypothetical protein
MPDDHSELVPPLPIPNRTVKRLCADDSAATSVKVGHRQAVIPENPRFFKNLGFFYVRHTKPHTHTNKNRPGSRRVGLFISAAWLRWF